MGFFYDEVKVYKNIFKLVDLFRNIQFIRKYQHDRKK